MFTPVTAGNAAAAPIPELRVGLDVGATKIHGVLLGDANAVLAELRMPTVPGVDGLVARMAAVIDAMLAGIGAARHHVGAIGVGVPGLVDVAGGAVIEAVNMGFDVTSAPLAQLMRTGFPTAVITIENDVNAATFGARSLLYPGAAELALISIGTGLAAGLISNGELLHGSSGAAGEIGHISINPEGLLCGCGQRGCLETLCSGAALSRAWGAEPGTDAASEIFDAADAGDPRGIEVRDRFVGAMGTALTLLALTTDPQVIVVGGGVASLGERLLAPVRFHLRRAATGSSLLARLAIAEKLAVLPSDVPVAAIGAALVAELSASRHPVSPARSIAARRG